MGRKVTQAEAAKDAQILLTQAIALLDDANIHIPAAHADMARHILREWTENDAAARPGIANRIPRSNSL